MERWSVRRPDGVELAVMRDGPAGPVALVAHGAGSSGRFVRAAFAEPVRRELGLALVTYDLRGHGASTPVHSPDRHGLAHHVADLAAVAETCDAVVIGGVSLGAHVALAHLARGGGADAAFACLPAWTGRAVPGEGPHAAVAADVARAGIPAMIAQLHADASLPDWLRDTLVTDWSVHHPASLAAALTSLDGGLAPTEAELRGLAVPTAVVGWPDDPGHPEAVARAWAEWLPGGRAVEASMDEMDTGVDHLGEVTARALRELMSEPEGR